MNSKYVESSFEGVFDESSYVCTYDDFYVKEDVDIRSIASSISSCFHEAEIIFDCSYDEESSSNEVFHSNESFVENIDMDQHFVNEHFHDDSCDLVSNHLLECEEVIVYVQSNLWITNIENEEKLDFTYS